MRETIRLKHYSYRTEQTYLDWIKRYLLFHQKKHPREMGGEEIRAFLTHLAVDKNVAAATQNQASTPSFSFIEKFLKLNWKISVHIYGQKVTNACPPSSPKKKCKMS
ncbi:phage integrase N-terminal SAM-like domain-containing protein [Microcystis aeruginosa FBCC-A68]|uniref:phage integrase N-terminal SAM-like domain-containing protein n=1 Tax=Microcystis aeruginosa TaxID=1126 RepID=UPI002015E701|nr:phage integrase N-terminal SAM-like domain-containing protein [Microcystis aeruginosa]